MNLNISHSLENWARHHTAAATIFVIHNLDFCCGGDKSLEKACNEKNLDPKIIANEIINSKNDKKLRHWDELSLSEAIDYILLDYHKKHRADLEHLIPLAEKVESVHADRKDRPVGLANFLKNLLYELDSHMQKEEQILFPMIKMGQGQMAEGPIQVMMMEHIGHGENLMKLREFVKNYNLPADACRSWQALYQGVFTLEKEVKEHISVENYVLFPKTLGKDPAQKAGCCGICS